MLACVLLVLTIFKLRKWGEDRCFKKLGGGIIATRHLFEKFPKVDGGNGDETTPPLPKLDRIYCLLNFLLKKEVERNGDKINGFTFLV